MTVDEYIKTLKPITDWSEVKKGDIIFSRDSLDLCEYRTFIEYNKEFDIISYYDMNGEELIGCGDHWFYSDGKFEYMKITHEMIRNGILNGKIKLGIEEGDMVAQIGDYWLWFGCTEEERCTFDEIVENIWVTIKDIESDDERNYYTSILRN